MTVDGARLVIACPIALALDWRTDGLADFLLRENGALGCGHLVRADETLVIEHVAFADAPLQEPHAAVGNPRGVEVVLAGAGLGGVKSSQRAWAGHAAPFASETGRY